MAAIVDERSNELLERPNSNPYLYAGLKVIIALAVAALVAAPFFLRKETTPDGRRIASLISTHDMAQHLAVMEQFDLALRSGVFYPRWQMEFNGGYGLPWTNFYQPGFFYLTSLVNAAVNDWVNTLFVITILSLAASGLALYALARQFYSRPASSIAALFYMIIPYHLLEIYWRGAMPELQGFIFVPAAFYFAYKLGTEGRARHYAGLGLFYGLFLMTHFPVAYLLTYTLAFYALIWAYRSRDRRIALRVAGGMMIGFFVSAIYLLPALIESKYTREHFTAIFPYHNSYITLMPGGDRFAELLNQSFAVQALALIVAVFILLKVPRTGAALAPPPPTGDRESPDSSVRSQTRLWIIVGLTTTFMSTSYSIYISKLIPQIEAVSFPWRWLVVTGFFTALLVGAGIDHLQHSFELKPKVLWIYRAAMGAALLVSLFVAVRGVILGSLSNSSLNRRPNHIEEAFVPRSAAGPNDLRDTPKVVIEPEGGGSEIIRWEPYHREVHVNVKEPSRVRLKTYNFPGWVARVDDRPAPMLGDKDGVQVVEVPAGVHVIEALFVNTPPRIAGGLLTAVGFLAVIGLAAFDRVKQPSPVAGARATQPAGSSSKRLAFVAAGLIGVALVFFWVTSRGRSAGSQQGAAPTRTAGSATQGSEATLHLDGVPSVLVAVDEQALAELMSALPARDTAKVDELVQSGRLLRLANDTRIRILEYAGGKTKIRILQGEHSMAEGWVAERWIR
ncbi:MAG: 6-pyruvoyl-tetrahydropterin synthase-related protein [Blastocatellia bacterium]